MVEGVLCCKKGKTMNIMSLLNALPGAVAQGLVWGIMAIGVYITFRILDFADLTVDGSLCTGGAVCIMMMLKGQNVWVSMVAALLAGMGGGGGCGRYGSRLRYRTFTYLYGDSGYPFRYPYTVGIIFY